MEACIWEFESWYDMSELQQACGGEITTDGQVLKKLRKIKKIKKKLKNIL